MAGWPSDDPNCRASFGVLPAVFKFIQVRTLIASVRMACVACICARSESDPQTQGLYLCQLELLPTQEHYQNQLGSTARLAVNRQLTGGDGAHYKSRALRHTLIHCIGSWENLMIKA